MIEQILPYLLPYLVGGVLAGLLSGLLGIGGGTIFVPIILYVLFLQGYPQEISVHIAVGTSLATVMVAALIGIVSHHRKKTLDFSLAKKWLIFFSIGGISGGIIIRYLSANNLKLIFAVLMFVIGIRFILQSFASATQKYRFNLPADNLYFRAGVGGSVGIAAALIGIGGSIFSTPIFMACKVPIHRAIALAPIINLSISVPTTILFAIQGMGIEGRPPLSIGYINLSAWLVFMPSILVMIPLGVRLAQHINGKYLQRFFGTYAILISIKTGLSAFGITAATILIGLN